MSEPIHQKAFAVPKTAPMAIDQLEAMVEHGCSSPECQHKNHDHVIIAQTCHPMAGVDVHYMKGSGVLTLRCRECNDIMVEIAVGLVGVKYTE